MTKNYPVMLVAILAFLILAFVFVWQNQKNQDDEYDRRFAENPRQGDQYSSSR